MSLWIFKTNACTCITIKDINSPSQPIFSISRPKSLIFSISLMNRCWRKHVFLLLLSFCHTFTMNRKGSLSAGISVKLSDVSPWSDSIIAIPASFSFGLNSSDRFLNPSLRIFSSTCKGSDWIWHVSVFLPPLRTSDVTLVLFNRDRTSSQKQEKYVCNVVFIVSNTNNSFPFVMISHPEKRTTSINNV